VERPLRVVHGTSVEKHSISIVHERTLVRLLARSLKLAKMEKKLIITGTFALHLWCLVIFQVDTMKWYQVLVSSAFS